MRFPIERSQAFITFRRSSPALLGTVIEVIDEHTCWINRGHHNTLYEYDVSTELWYPTCVDYGDYKVDIRCGGFSIEFIPELEWEE